MATFDSPLVQKKHRARANYGGRAEQLTGVLRVKAGSSIALADLIRMLLVGENVRPVRLILSSTPVSGTPVLTNPTFNCGVAPVVLTTPYTRPDGTQYPAAATSATAFASGLVINADNMNTIIEVSRPVADSVSKYGPSYVTLTPAGAGAFSVAGGDIDLSLTIEFLGEQKADGFIYTEYVNQKVK